MTEQLEPETAQCDCCGDMKPRDEISRIWAFGIETFACRECRHDGVMPDPQSRLTA